MKEQIVYRPIKVPIMCAYIGSVCSILSFILVMLSFSANVEFAYTGIAVCILSIWVMVFSIKNSKQCLIFSEEGLRVIEGWSKRHRDFQWKDFSYAYDSSNYKGFRHWVLSPVKLNAHEAKSIVNKCSVMTSRLCYDCFVVIPIVSPKCSEDITDFVNNKINNIHQSNCIPDSE